MQHMFKGQVIYRCLYWCELNPYFRITVIQQFKPDEFSVNDCELFKCKWSLYIQTLDSELLYF